jgi:hypothetical protein
VQHRSIKLCCCATCGASDVGSAIIRLGCGGIRLTVVDVVCRLVLNGGGGRPNGTRRYYTGCDLPCRPGVD